MPAALNRARRRGAAAAACLLGALLAATACGEPHEDEMRTLTREELLDPETCKGCHPQHYREWSVSMHAYAADDPVFVAMNARGQDETRGTDHELGTFCVRCHAPMALVEEPSFDAADVQDLPRELKGVTCYFCHNAVEIGEHANGDIVLANDTTMRGGIGRGTALDPAPVQPPAHRAEYSRLHDLSLPESSILCGACHDVITPEHGVHLERTLEEWKNSLLSRPSGFQSCQDCHMRRFGEDPVASYPGAPPRGVHEHLWPGVDVAMTDFPDPAGRAAMRAAVEECALRNSVDLKVAFTQDEPGRFRLYVRLETEAGHAMPSGAAQDRRMWVEVVAFDAAGEMLLESGMIADDALEEQPEGHPEHDGLLWLMRDRLRDADGNEVHMFWEAVSYDDVTNPSLPAPPPPPALDHWLDREYPLAGVPARATVRVRIRPIGMDVLNDLVDAGYLDPGLVAEMPTFTVEQQELFWDTDDMDHPRVVSTQPDCDRYKCLLDPGSEWCMRE